METVLYERSRNHFHNILKFFDVLPNFPFTTSQRKCAVQKDAVIAPFVEQFKTAPSRKFD